jgi:hypothetical protein
MTTKNSATYEGKVLIRETPGMFHRFAPVGGLVCGATTAYRWRETDGQHDLNPCPICFAPPEWIYERTHSLPL